MSDEWQKGCAARTEARALRELAGKVPPPSPPAPRQPRFVPSTYAEVKAAMDALREAETAAARAMFRYRVPV